MGQNAEFSTLYGSAYRLPGGLCPWRPRPPPRAWLLVALVTTSRFNRSVNPEIVKLACCNFLIITVMYIKVYISGVETSHRIHFWYQILPKLLIFLENGKKITFFVKKIVTKKKKKQLWVENAEIAWK